MRIKIGKQRVNLVPFIWAVGAWGTLGISVLSAFSSDRSDALQAFFIYFSLSILDLFFIVKTVAAILVLMSDQGAKNRTAYAIQAFIFGGLKFICLGVIALCLWKIPSRTSGGLLFGLGALVAIPLLGGFLWSQQELKDTE